MNIVSKYEDHHSNVLFLGVLSNHVVTSPGSLRGSTIKEEVAEDNVPGSVAESKIIRDPVKTLDPLFRAVVPSVGT